MDDCAGKCNQFTMATNDPNRLYETILQLVTQVPRGGRVPTARRHRGHA